MTIRAAVLVAAIVCAALVIGCQPQPTTPTIYKPTDQECAKRCTQAYNACIVSCPANGDACFDRCHDDFARCNSTCGFVPVRPAT